MKFYMIEFLEMMMMWLWMTGEMFHLFQKTLLVLLILPTPCKNNHIENLALMVWLKLQCEPLAGLVVITLVLETALHSCSAVLGSADCRWCIESLIRIKKWIIYERLNERQ